MVHKQNLERILVLHFSNLSCTCLFLKDLAKEEQLSNALCTFFFFLAHSPTAQCFLAMGFVIGLFMQQFINSPEGISLAFYRNMAFAYSI